MATQPTPEEEHEHGKSEKQAKKQSLVVVELAKRRSPEQVRRLRKGHGRLLTDIEDAVDELVESGTIKAGTPPVVVVVREATLPLLWAIDYAENDEDEEEDDEEDDEEEEDEDDD